MLYESGNIIDAILYEDVKRFYLQIQNSKKKVLLQKKLTILYEANSEILKIKLLFK